jgi:hypothetical protein
MFEGSMALWAWVTAAVGSAAVLACLEVGKGLHTSIFNGRNQTITTWGCKYCRAISQRLFRQVRNSAATTMHPHFHPRPLCCSVCALTPPATLSSAGVLIIMRQSATGELEDMERCLVLSVGGDTFQSIAMLAQGQESPRPMSLDLLWQVVSEERLRLNHVETALHALVALWQQGIGPPHMLTPTPTTPGNADPGESPSSDAEGLACPARGHS